MLSLLLRGSNPRRHASASSALQRYALKGVDRRPAVAGVSEVLLYGGNGGGCSMGGGRPGGGMQTTYVRGLVSFYIVIPTLMRGSV